jgi:hypothetical protein
VPQQLITAETAETIGNQKCAADLTVRDMLVLPEVTAETDPGRRRDAARRALAVARRASLDAVDPEWSPPTTWTERQAAPHWRARRVRDCDGHLWERRHTIEDGDVFEIDAWSPRGQRADAPYFAHSWAELITHYGPVTEGSSNGWPHFTPVL